MPKEQKQKKDKSSTRQLLGIRELLDHCLRTDHGDLVCFIVKPSNLSVLSEHSVRARVNALSNVLQGSDELELYCLNSRESFDDNKQYLRHRLGQEHNTALRKLLEQDIDHFDAVQVQMATAREFLILLRLTDNKDTEVLPYLDRVHKSLGEQSFTARRAAKEDLKSILAIYLEQNVTTERFEDFDGERWMILND